MIHVGWRRAAFEAQLRLIAAACLLLFLAAAPQAARSETPPAPDPSLLTLDRIFASGDFGSDHGPEVHWLERGGYVGFEDSPLGGGKRDLVWRHPDGDRREALVQSHRFAPPGDNGPLSVDSYEFSADGSKLLIYTNSQRVWRTRSRGDYWVLDIAGGELVRLGGDSPPSSLMFARFSPDGLRVAYVRDHNLFVQDLRSREITQLTHDGSPTRINGAFDWVYEEELQLQRGFRFSSDSRWLAYWQIDDEGVPTFPLVDQLAGVYPSVRMIPYPKVGERNPAARIGVVPVGGGETAWLAISGDPREHYLAALEWIDGTHQLVIQQLDRLQQHNRVFLADAETGNARLLFTESDAAWIDHVNPTLHWLPDRKSFLWLSEQQGWRQIYQISLEGERGPAITPHGWDVIDFVALDPAGEWLYFTASPENPTQEYLYRVRRDGSQLARLSPADQPGTHHYRLSPDARWAVHTYSTFDQPPLEELVGLPEHKQLRLLADNQSLRDKLKALKPVKSEFFRVEAAPGVALDGWRLLPADFDPAKKYPVLFYVYGEPAGQTVADSWGGNRRLWHQYLAQQGYVVMSLDNRGADVPRGRAWRKSVHRQVGVLASADQAAATQALLAQHKYLDPERIAIWGWSGGGSMTLNALFRYPKLYKAGLAVAPVPNQRYYDTIYQERYMGLPGDNAEGYRQGSPITHAHQLEGRLLLVHGTGDDNCHFQGAEALADELIAHNKQFDFFPYPARSHSNSERQNTTRHLHGLLTRQLEEYVPSGPR